MSGHRTTQAPPQPRAAPPGFDPAVIEPPPLRERRWPVEALALDVSGRCNLACRYCAEAATQPRRRPAMEREILDRAVAWLGEGARSGGSIRLGSGEPLLAGGLLRGLAGRLAAARRAGAPAPEVFLTTNGTRLDAATREWLVESGWHVKVSLDGPPAIHDRWRVTARGRPTWRQAAAAVRDLAARIPARFSVTAVLCRGAAPAEVFDAIAALGVRRIELVPVGHPDPDVLPDAADVVRYRDFVDDYVARYAADPAGVPELVKVINAARRVMGYDVKRVTCGAGRNFLGVGPDGGLYPCFRFIGVDAYRIGHIAAGVDQVAAERFRQAGGRPYDQREPCRACWAAPLCGGPCFAEAELLGPGGGAPFALHCDYVRADAAGAFALVERLRARDPERLLDLLAGFIDF